MKYWIASFLPLFPGALILKRRGTVLVEWRVVALIVVREGRAARGLAYVVACWVLQLLGEAMFAVVIS